MPERWTAFLDLLGTRYRASLKGIGGLESALEDFQSFCANYTSYLSRNSQVYFFSDSLFVEADSIESLAKYIQELRYNLFIKNIYFKCAITSGPLEAVEWRSQAMPQEHDRAKIWGYRFGKSAVASYTRHEQFHGIGAIIDDGGINPTIKNEYLVPSVFLAKEGSGGAGVTYRSHWDVRYAKDEEVGVPIEPSHLQLTPDNDPNSNARAYLDLIINAMMKAKTIWRAYGSLFIPPLVSMVRCSNFEHMQFDENKRQWRVYPVVLKTLLLNNELRHCTDVPGIASVFFATLGRVLNNRDLPQSAKDDIIWRVMSKTSLRSKIGSMPATLLDADEKESVIDRWAALSHER